MIKYEDIFRARCLMLIKSNFTPFEFAELFELDKSNACAYLRGSKKIPLSLCFNVIQYLGCNFAIFSPK